ncbi:MAG: hypothetical protein WC832_03090 [Anaerolineales bacterium]
MWYLKVVDHRLKDECHVVARRNLLQPQQIEILAQTSSRPHGRLVY